MQIIKNDQLNWKDSLCTFPTFYKATPCLHLPHLLSYLHFSLTLLTSYWSPYFILVLSRVNIGAFIDITMPTYKASSCVYYHINNGVFQRERDVPFDVYIDSRNENQAQHLKHLVGLSRGKNPRMESQVMFNPIKSLTT